MRRKAAGATVIIAIAALTGCGGRERVVKPAGEGPNLEIAILTCNLERVKALTEENPELTRDAANSSLQYPLATAIHASRLCGPQIFEYLLNQHSDTNQVVLNTAL